MARSLHKAVQIQDKVWITGGYSDEGYNLLADIWQLDLETLRWSKLNRELPVPVCYHAMTVTDEGKMVMFGGLVDNDNEEEDTVTPTNAVHTSWLTLPSLRSMAWEAVCHYWPEMSSLPASTLMKEGVPKDCVEMLDSIKNNNNV